jgi:Domain of unknown function (DUF4440)
MNATTRLLPSAGLILGFAANLGFAATPGNDPGERGVREAEDGWSRAFVSGDAAFLEALLDPAYVSVGTHGNVRAKADIIALAKRYASEHPGSSVTALPPTSKIDVKGASAVVVHHNKDDTSVDVFYYAGGRWHAWYSQHTAITPVP